MSRKPQLQVADLAQVPVLKPKAREPMAEGFIKPKNNGRRAWSSLSDDVLIQYVRDFMTKRGITGKSELQIADPSLYQTLRNMDLLGKVGFEAKHKYAVMNDDALIDHARSFMKDRCINGKTELKMADLGMYDVLRKRILLDKVGFVAKLRDWASMSNEELIGHARYFMKENGMNRRTELEKADGGMYRTLLYRGLLDRVFTSVESQKRSDAVSEIIDTLDELNCEGFCNLRPAESDLLHLTQLKRVKKVPIVDGIIKLKKNGQSNLVSFSDSELIAYTKGFMKDRKITGRTELRKAASGVYLALMKRKLLDKVGFETKHKYAVMNDDALIDHARSFVKERGINTRKKFSKEACGMHDALYNRGLLDRVGFEERFKYSVMSDFAFIEHVKAFMKGLEISGKKELEKARQGMYLALCKRGLLDKVGFEEKHRDWAGMIDDKFIEYTRSFMKGGGIKGRKKLSTVASGMYQALYKRGLLDRVFASVDSQKRSNAILGVLDALDEFGDAE